MLRITWILFIWVLLLPGCWDRDLNIKIKYDRINGLEQGDRVIFDNNSIGHVDSVYHSEDGRYLVGVTIKRNFANAATENSRFYIIKDPRIKEKMAVELTRVNDGGALLKDGDTIEGSTRSSAILEKAREELEKSVEELRKQFDGFSRELKKIPENEEFRKFKDELEQLPDRIKKAGKAAREKIEKDVLPKLKREMEQLRRRFLGPEKEKEDGPVKT